MNTDLMFSSATDLWSTPQDFFDKLNAEFGFTLDVCATSENAKCAAFYTEAEDSLVQRWVGVCWMNPPYGDPESPCKKGKNGAYNCKKKRCRTCADDPTPNCAKGICGHRGFHIDVYVPGIIDFVRKAYCESVLGATVVCLVPARTDTEWWHDYCQKGEVEFIRGRLKFGGQKNSAPFPSAVVVFRPKVEVE